MVRVEDVEKEIFAKATSIGKVTMKFFENDGSKLVYIIDFYINPTDLKYSRFTNKKKFRPDQVKMLDWVFEEATSFIIEFKMGI